MEKNRFSSPHWLITARPLDDDGRLSERNEIVEDGLIFGRFDNNYAVKETTAEDWIDEINSANPKHIIFYLHGFNNPPYKKVVSRIENIHQQMLTAEFEDFVIVPIFWPTQKDLMPANNYFQDQKWADATAQLINNHLLDKTVALQHVNLHFVAHSMGARVLMHSLQDTQYPHLNNLFLIAPDIENEALEPGNKGQVLSTTFDNVTLFYAKDDFALRTSIVANMANKVVSRRLGLTGAENPHLLPNNVRCVDCNQINFQFDKAKGHSYFVAEDNEVTPVVNIICQDLQQIDANQGQ